MLRIPRSVVPNSFTVGNMFFGFMSIVIAVNQQNFMLAAWMIGGAALMDALDGKIARITNSSSKFGVEYDSLADVVSFGVAPSVLIYQFYFIHVPQQSLGMLFSFMPLLFGSIRLARFNVELTGFTKSHFSGLPIPAAAITIGSYILLVEQYFDGSPYPQILITVTALTSLLMVSNVRYEILPKLTFKGSGKQKVIFLVFIILVIVVLILVVLDFKIIYMLIFPTMILYILGGLVTSIFIKTSNRRKMKKMESERRSGAERRLDDLEEDEDEI